jgi:hypothetical protein
VAWRALKEQQAAVEQGVAADKAGASDGALQLNASVIRTMRLTKRHAVLVSTLLLGACDEYEKAYTNVSAAESDGAFERGWLPPILPSDAQNIVERHNLDTNRTWGCFYTPGGPAAVKEKLFALKAKPASGPIGPPPTGFLATRPWWPSAMATKEIDAYELPDEGRHRLLVGIEAGTNRVCFFRG